MSDDEIQEFQDEVSACAEEIKQWLPALAERHTPLILLAALSEHVGGSLRIFQDTGLCTAAQARAVLERLTRITYAGQTSL
ncbi:MAG TPA: hypothetical protein VJQ47_10170 [Steroidobacteraceae bacterium]|nr:hypothetical protein [Steroidobacteraceae bacterium]